MREGAAQDPFFPPALCRKPQLIRHRVTTCPISHGKSDHRERLMNYLSNVANERPMLRVAATVIFAFFCAAPLVLLFSSLVVLGVRSLLH